MFFFTLTLDPLFFLSLSFRVSETNIGIFFTSRLSYIIFRSLYSLSLQNPSSISFTLDPFLYHSLSFRLPETDIGTLFTSRLSYIIFRSLYSLSLSLQIPSSISLSLDPLLYLFLFQISSFISFTINRSLPLSLSLSLSLQIFSSLSFILDPFLFFSHFQSVRDQYWNIFTSRSSSIIFRSLYSLFFQNSSSISFTLDPFLFLHLFRSHPLSLSFQILFSFSLTFRVSETETNIGTFSTS